MNLSRERLIQVAEQTGFRSELLEKAIRLLALFDGLRSHPFLKSSNRGQMISGTMFRAKKGTRLRTHLLAHTRSSTCPQSRKHIRSHPCRTRVEANCPPMGHVRRRNCPSPGLPSRTCLPASQAEFLGHDNLDDRVKTTQVSGVGGRSRAFIHTLRMELIDFVIFWFDPDSWYACIPNTVSAIAPTALRTTVHTLWPPLRSEDTTTQICPGISSFVVTPQFRASRNGGVICRSSSHPLPCSNGGLGTRDHG